MACIRVSLTNNSESILFNDIYNNIANNNEELADNLFTHFKTEIFKNDFGDYISDYKNNIVSDRVDENGEPKLFFNETANKYYYLNKNNEKIYFPLVNKGLRGIWSYEQINNIRSRLALSYFKNTKLNFNNIDFTKASSLPKLSLFIEKEIKDKISSLEEEGEYFAALTLEDSLNYLDELTEKVENFFKEISLEIVENEDEDIELIEEEGKDPIFNQNIAERNTKESISTNVKLRLSLLEDLENLDPIWNEPTFLNKDKVYSALQSVLCEEIALPGEDIFNLHKYALNRIINKKPYLKQLHEYLNSPDLTEEQKSEFSQAFNLIKNNHIVTSFTKDKDYVSNKVMQISDSGSKIITIKIQWDDNFKDIFLKEDNSLKDNSTKKINDLVVKLKSLIDNSEKLRNSIKEDSFKQDFEKLNNNILSLLKEVGVETTEEGYQTYLDSYGKTISNKDMLDNVYTLLEQLKYTLNTIRTKYAEPSEEYDSFLTVSQVFNKLALTEAFYLDEGSDATILTGGKQKWIYSYPSYLSTTIKQWKRKPELVIDLYNSSSYQKGSFYLGYLSGSIDKNGNKLEYNNLKEQITNSRKLLEKIDIGIMNQMSSNNDFKKTTELSYKDYLTDYINKVISGDFIRTTTPADKSTDLQLKFNLPVSSYNGVKDGKVTLKKQTLNILYNYFASEYNRMLEATNDIELAKLDPKNNKLTPHYHYKYGNNNIYDKSGNAFKSQYFDKLSLNSKDRTLLEEKLYNKLYSNSELNYSKLERGIDLEFDELFDEYITDNFNERFKETLNYLQDSDILKRNDDGVIVTNKIDNKILKEKYNSFSDNQKAYAVVSDYIINSIISNIEFSKMFSGDVAYYKNMVDYKKRVPATYTDGLQLRITDGNENFNIATINSVIINSPFYDKLVESLGEENAKVYKDINSTDAQAWITPQRWKFLLKALGKWTTGQDSHESVYHKMTDNTDKNIFYTEKELKLAAQPLKGVYFSRDSYGKPTYLKYSQAVLSRELIKNDELEKIYDKMIKSNVDELITFDGVKVGAIEPTTIHNLDGTLKDEFEFNVQTLSNRGWKLQQDLPTKTFKDTDVGSQIQKNIFAGLRFNKETNGFILNNQEYSGEEISEEIVNTIKGLTNEGIKSLKEEFNIDDNFKINNIDGFYNSLINEIKKRGGSENIVKALESQTSIIGIPQSSSKLYNIFASVINSRLIKVKTNGGSFIQMSNFGLSKQQGNTKGVRWSPNADNKTNEPYIYLNKETGRKTVKPGGILISASFLSKSIPDWKKYTDKELFISYNGGKPIIDQKIQENIIGYRIPNQGLASNDSLQIVGILPESMGDTIVAYTGITTKTGSDKILLFEPV